jgi:outer membrane protein assembly factor BamB
MKIDDLVFVGLNGYAVALHRDSGELVWKNSDMRNGYVTLLLDGDRLVVSTNGYIYCLDPLTGSILWHNPMKGFGSGSPTALLSARGQGSHTLMQHVTQMCDASATAAAAAAATAS